MMNTTNHRLAPAKNTYGIAWTGIPHAAGIPEVKVLALAQREGAAYVMPTLETIRDRTYPLTRSVFMYVNRAPGKALAPSQREFLRYVLSREGQEAVARNGNYIPLTAAAVEEGRRQLDGRP